MSGVVRLILEMYEAGLKFSPLTSDDLGVSEYTYKENAPRRKTVKETKKMQK